MSIAGNPVDVTVSIPRRSRLRRSPRRRKAAEWRFKAYGVAGYRDQPRFSRHPIQHDRGQRLYRLRSVLDQARHLLRSRRDRSVRHAQDRGYSQCELSQAGGERAVQADFRQCRRSPRPARGRSASVPKRRHSASRHGAGEAVADRHEQAGLGARPLGRRCLAEGLHQPGHAGGPPAGHAISRSPGSTSWSRMAAWKEVQHRTVHHQAIRATRKRQVSPWR